MFKSDWEKRRAEDIPRNDLQKILSRAFESDNILRWHAIEGGCANLNLKVFLKDQDNPKILRLYLRDPKAVYREEKLGRLLKNILPIPCLEKIDIFENYHFAVVSFLNGQPLRDLILQNPHDPRLDYVMQEAGGMLAKLASFQFSEPGFFDENLNIVPPQ